MLKNYIAAKLRKKKRRKLYDILVCVLGMRAWGALRTKQVEKQYCRAAEQIAAGDYREGRETLRSICGLEYADADALFRLCEACEYLEEEKYTWAWYTIRDFAFEELPEEEESEIRLILSEIEDGYQREQGYVISMVCAENIS